MTNSNATDDTAVLHEHDCRATDTPWSPTIRNVYLCEAYAVTGALQWVPNANPTVVDAGTPVIVLLPNTVTNMTFLARGSRWWADVDDKGDPNGSGTVIGVPYANYTTGMTALTAPAWLSLCYNLVWYETATGKFYANSAGMFTQFVNGWKQATACDLPFFALDGRGAYSSSTKTVRVQPQIVAWLASDASSINCPLGWVRGDPAGSPYCFRVFAGATTSNYAAAESACAMQPVQAVVNGTATNVTGHLASLRSLAEWTTIKTLATGVNLLPDTQQIYLGLISTNSCCQTKSSYFKWTNPASSFDLSWMFNATGGQLIWNNGALWGDRGAMARWWHSSRGIDGQRALTSVLTPPSCHGIAGEPNHFASNENCVTIINMPVPRGGACRRCACMAGHCCWRAAPALLRTPRPCRHRYLPQRRRLLDLRQLLVRGASFRLVLLRALLSLQ